MSRTITIRRRGAHSRVTPASVTGAEIVGPRLLGPAAMAPLSLAACAVGALAIGRVAIANAVIRKLSAGEVEIRWLKVQELEVSGRRWPEATPESAHD